MLSHHVWQGTYGGDRSIIGGALFVEGKPFTVVGVTPPGFFGETLRGDPPDLWIPLQQEPLINGETSILRQPVAAWLRVIGRLRPGATTDSMGPRLTGILHQWMQHDSGYPANWMPDVIQSLPKQVITVVPAGAGVGIMKEQYRAQPADSARRLRIGAYTVAQRTNEIGLRMALGADRGRVVGMVLNGAFRRVAIGLGLGLPLAVGAGRLLAAQLYGVQFWDPLALSLAAVFARRVRVPCRHHPGRSGSVYFADDRPAGRIGTQEAEAIEGTRGNGVHNEGTKRTETNGEDTWSPACGFMIGQILVNGGDPRS